MELLYLWINKSKFDTITQQEFNFSPLYKFSVDNPQNPKKISCEHIDTVNLFKSREGKGKINNITAIVGANGAGKTSLLSFIAKNNCFPLSQQTEESNKYDIYTYEHDKSIYVFEDNGKLIVYHDLKNELECCFDSLQFKINGNESNKTKMLCEMRKQLLVYVTNSSFVPETMQGYSQDDKTYNVNLHPKSMYIVAKYFYLSLFQKDGFADSLKEDDDGFAWIIKEQRNERTFQELLDVLYYHFLIREKNKEWFGEIREQIYIEFDDILSMIKKKYCEDFIILNKTKIRDMQIGGRKSDKNPSELCRKYYEKIRNFEEHYNPEEIRKYGRKNNTIALYLNLLFEAYFYKNDFVLPVIDFHEDIYEQIQFSLSGKYKEYLDAVKKIDNILSKCKMYDNLIENPDDLSCLYCKLVPKDCKEFFKYMSNAFENRESFVLKYIRIRNLNMSSGERAMQNMFSWLLLIPQLDEIMGMKRNKYESKLILIDEIDLYCHPEWQKRIVSQLLFVLNRIEKNVPVQIIITTHSPLILSDFPRNNIVYMKKIEGRTIVDKSTDHKQSFGANIYTLLNDSFFLENGAVGEFAREKILNIYENLKEDNHQPLDEKKQKEYEQVISMIGDGIVKQEMQRLFRKKCSTEIQMHNMISSKSRKELEELKKRIEDELSRMDR